MIDLKLDTAGVRELLKSEDVQAALQELADDVRTRCGDGFDTSAYKGRNRANVSVFTADDAAKRKNAEDNTILKALEG